jgi:hypothetical protein
LPVGAHVYRAVTLPNAVKNGKAKPPAFFRRARYNSNGEERKVWDQIGLSFGMSAEEACQGLAERPTHVIKLSVERLAQRNIRFDEPDANGHINAIDIPFSDDRDAATKVAFSMIECVEEIIAL